MAHFRSGWFFAIGLASAATVFSGFQTKAAAAATQPDPDLKNSVLAVDVDAIGVLPVRHMPLATNGFTADIAMAPKWGVGRDGRVFAITWANIVDTRITATLKSGSYDQGGGEGHYVQLYPDQLVQRVTVTFGNGKVLDQPLDSTGGNPIDIPAGAKWIQKIDVAFDGGNAKVLHFVWNFKLAPPTQQHIVLQIAPMLKPAASGDSNGNEPPDSDFTDVTGGADGPPAGFRDFDDVFNFTNANLGKIQKAIFQRIGITACGSEPENLKDKDGALDFIDISEVLNDDGHRTSFGYFIRFEFTPATSAIKQHALYFALFSYDKIKFKQKDKLPICATEFFLFDYTGADQTQTLRLGLALGKDGQRLAAVPIELAHVSNFRLGHPKDEPVRPGVQPGQGCMICHGAVGKTPQQTLPFPWIAAVAPVGPR